MIATKVFDALHSKKYREPEESFEDCTHRVATALADSREHEKALEDILEDRRFLPGGRIQRAMGSPRKVTAFNCFVSDTIHDDMTSIMDRLARAATTLRMGGGIGYDFSTLRPRGTPIKTLGSESTGPVAFMAIYDALCKCIASSGHRRGAQMGIMRVDHFDILEFIHAKRDAISLTAFNISVAITDEFMLSLETGAEFSLKWGLENKPISASALWDEIMRSTYDWAEPGIVFIDRMNSDNNLQYCEKISATNPCSEQPLPPNGACCLGSFNLTKYVDFRVKDFDYQLLIDDILSVVRALDNVIDRSEYPLVEQKDEAQGKRRLGIGITGLANSLEALGLPYGSREFLEMQSVIMSVIEFCAYRASIGLAIEKGSFPLLDRERFVESGFCRRALGPNLRRDILRHGIRNSHLLSVAPTGTISLCAGNVSSGIEPVFDHCVNRVIDGERVELEDYALSHWGVRGLRAHEVPVETHLAVQAVAQRHVDSAVSKTVNVPKGASFEAFKGVYQMAWDLGCKGCATFRDGGMRTGILSCKVGEGNCDA